jgi:hypothetical protein
MSTVATDQMPGARWSDAWPDLLAFAAGLALAWTSGWNTTDLVWSLWLSSLAVGYVTIVAGALAPAVLQFREGATARGFAAAISGLVLIAFFTVHFGIFHAGHAAFLSEYFPVLPGHKQRGFVDLELLAEVVRRYGWFLPIVLVAERHALRLPAVPREPPRMSVRAADIAARKARQAIGSALMFRPYLNVVRLHLLIFFFAAVHAAALGGFAVYALIYAVYFFPWRLLLRRREIGAGVAQSE